MDNKLWLVLFIIIAAFVIGAALTSEQCSEFNGDVVCVRTTRVYGVAVGVPGESASLPAFVFTDVRIATEKNDPVGPALAWLAKANKPRDGVWKITVSNKDAGALLVCSSEAFKNNIEGVLEWLGVNQPSDKEISISGAYCLVFYGYKKAE